MEETSCKEQPSKKKKMLNEILSWLGSLVMAIVIVVLLRTLVFTLIRVDGNSMKNTLLDGDRLYVSVLTPRITGYERGDIVICTYPGADHQCVKRILGLPGETVEIVKGNVYIDGVLIEEDYLDYHASYSREALTLGEGEYYVLGDNRPISRDSHSNDVGPVTRLHGKVRFIFWPLNRIGAAE